MPTNKITHSFPPYKLVHKAKMISLLNLKDLKIVILLFLGSLDDYYTILHFFLIGLHV